MERKATELEKKVFMFLNDLRDSGVTNMFGARPYIEDAFEDIDTKEASRLLSLWMSNFSDTGDYEIITTKE